MWYVVCRVFFFFSSRRRHTRCSRDWSSDVCSSDLEKTIPQEVRFDVIGGVSYTKGCYTGQETVSRLHFRGHPNRQLRGLAFEQPPAEGGALPVVHAEREVGRVTSVTWLPEGAIGGPAGGRGVRPRVVRRQGEPGPLGPAAGVEGRRTGPPVTFAP